MYKCMHCGATFEEPAEERYTECHTEVDNRRLETYIEMICPYCGSVDIADTPPCPVCGMWKPLAKEYCEYCTFVAGEHLEGLAIRLKTDFDVALDVMNEYLLEMEDGKDN